MNIQGDVTLVSSYFNAEISMMYKKEMMSLKTIAIYHPLLSTLRGEGGGQFISIMPIRRSDL